MLIDEFMPPYQFSENHSIVIKIKSNSNVLSVIKDITPASANQSLPSSNNNGGGRSGSGSGGGSIPSQLSTLS